MVLRSGSGRSFWLAFEIGLLASLIVIACVVLLLRADSLPRRLLDSYWQSAFRLVLQTCQRAIRDPVALKRVLTPSGQAVVLELIYGIPPVIVALCAGLFSAVAVRANAVRKRWRLKTHAEPLS